ncbi:MAG: RdgB/HAM1 family non-canonical purine NTP pyrophosphatase [Salibacteraceae bacterium]
MKSFVFATNNPNKLSEIRSMLDGHFKVLSLKDVDIQTEIPETGDTLEANALEKARFIYDRVKLPCFSDDTGLEIDALQGRPGVYSARYAGPNCSPDDNMEKVLGEMQKATQRAARFRTVIALIEDEKETLFEGAVNGAILTEKQGEKGFGYDPIYQPEGETQSFAEMSAEAKNAISHRGRATRKLAEFLLASVS